MAERRRADERQSTYSWVKGLQRFADRYQPLVRAMEAHHNHAQNLQPIKGLAAAMIEELLAGVRATAGAAESWYGTARAAQQRDMERVEDPAGGSHGRERRGDVGYTHRDR